MRNSVRLLLTLSTVAAFNSQCKSSEQKESDSEAKGIFFNRSNDVLVLPRDYESQSAEKKADILYGHIERTKFSAWPALESVNPLEFIFSHMMMKMDFVSDEASVGYEKSLHAHGVAGKFEFRAIENPYTGLFKGVPYGIIRMSLTSDPKGVDFAPGIALKFLIDGLPSRNVSALYKLAGQKSNHNFFENELSNIIPVQVDPKAIFSQANFGRVTSNPTKISVKPFASVDAAGTVIDKPVAPLQIYFVPNSALKFKAAVHDFREDLTGIPENTVLYDVYATNERGINFVNIDEARRAKAVMIGQLVSKSKLIASDFGDRRLFFRHYKFEEND